MNTGWWKTMSNGNTVRLEQIGKELDELEERLRDLFKDRGEDD